MKPSNNGRSRRIRTLFFGICMFLLVGLTAMSCSPVNVTPAFRLSSGQCQGRNTAPVAGERTLAVVAIAGPNITICILRASDGSLLRHYDLDIYGEVVGQGDGLLYVSKHEGDLFILCAIHISDGVKRWCQTQLKSDNFTSVTASNGIAYASLVDQTGKRVTAISERDGQVLWNFRTLDDPSMSVRVLIAIGHGAVYINTYQNPQAGSPIPTTSAISTTSVTTMMSASLSILEPTATPVPSPTPTPPATPTLPTIAGTPPPQVPDLVPGVKSVCALQASDGGQLWCKPFSGESISGMAADEKTLYVRTINNTSRYSSIYALDPADGSVRWHSSLMLTQSTYGLPQLVVAHGMVLMNALGGDVASAPFGSDQLYAWSASDGKQLWSRPQPGLVDSLSATDKLLYTVANTGVVSALNMLDGTPAWSRGSSAPPNSSAPYSPGSGIMVGQDAAYILMRANNVSHILALGATDGAELWEDKECAIATPTPVVGTPTSNGAINRCYWITRGGMGEIQLRLLQVDNV